MPVAGSYQKPDNPAFSLRRATGTATGTTPATTLATTLTQEGHTDKRTDKRVESAPLSLDFKKLKKHSVSTPTMFTAENNDTAALEDDDTGSVKDDRSANRNTVFQETNGNFGANGSGCETAHSDKRNQTLPPKATAKLRLKVLANVAEESTKSIRLFLN